MSVVRSSELCRDGDVSIRLFRNDPADIRLLVSWQAEPHVREWWDPDEPPPSFDEVGEKYGRRAHPTSPIVPCMIELDGRPIGYVQFYQWSSLPDEVAAMALPTGERSFGLDILIGEPDLVGAGIGSRAVALLCRHLARDRGGHEVLLTTELTNTRAHRSFEKAGFVKIKDVWDVETRDGERIHSWLMRWTPRSDR